MKNVVVFGGYGNFGKKIVENFAGIIALYIIILTFIDANFWLYLFGPTIKNIPIIVLIGYEYISSVNCDFKHIKF